MNEPKTIVFLAVNASFSHSSLAAWVLRSFVDRARWRWETVEATTSDDLQTVLSRIVAHQPAVLAATLYLFNRDYVLSVLGRYKALAPRCRIIVGGPECLGDNEALLRGGHGVDAAVRGEGEYALAELLDIIDDRPRWTVIPGVCTLVDGKYSGVDTARVVENLDDIPPFYDAYLTDFKKPFVQIETSRGCGNACSFCTSGGVPLRHYSLERVRADLAVIRRRGVRQVRVVDRTFNEMPRRAIHLVRMFRDEFQELRFHLEVDPARMTSALLAELAQAAPNRFHIEAGVQSLSPRVYRKIQRKATVKRTLDGVRTLCACRSLAIHVDLIAGLPGATLNDVLRDIRTLVALRPGDIQLERLKLLPGTPLDKVRQGIVAASRPPYEVMCTPNMSFEDLRYVDRLSKLLDWFYNVGPLQEIACDASEALADFWAGLERWVRENHGFAGCPSLEQRFRLMDGFLAQRGSTLVHRLRYNWLRQGFSARHGLCAAAPWKSPIPAGAVLVEGKPDAVIARKWVAELDHRYVFAYGTGEDGSRAVVAVYRLADG